MASSHRPPDQLRQEFNQMLGYWDKTCATHLGVSGVRTHTRAVLRHGASVAEIVEVLVLTEILGPQSVTSGLPILLAEAVQHQQAA